MVDGAPEGDTDDGDSRNGDVIENPDDPEYPRHGRVHLGVCGEM